MSIMKEVKNAIRNPYVWPGGYPLSIITSDGEIICPDCAKENFRLIVYSTRHKVGDGWQAFVVDVLWEGGNHCSECNKNVDAYPE